MRALLEDIRVVAIEQYGAGPFGTLQLVELGADVVKIEDPHVGGDVSRYVPPYTQDTHSLFFECFNRNKRSLALDLRNPEARPVFDRLVSQSDAVISNLRGDQPEKLRIRYDDLRNVKPEIVCVSLSGFGMSGPRRGLGAYDYTVQGLAGWQSLTGEPDGPPAKSGLPLADLSAGYALAIAVLAGVHAARRDGVGRDFDLSLYEVARAELTYIGTWAASRGYEPVRRPQSAHQSIVPFQNLRARDGWIVVACPKEHLWRRLCDVVGRPDLAEDPRFRTFADRDRNRETLIAMLEALLATRTVAEWCGSLERAGVPAAPVNTVAEALADPAADGRSALVETEHPVLGTVRHVRSPFNGVVEAKRGPFLGEHTEEILHQLDLDRDEILRLRGSGVFGSRARRSTT
jgi:crotonobetainyl-CoA:carnitine CoA-transferase CaiB-like acyl-CoA transferase